MDDSHTVSKTVKNYTKTVVLIEDDPDIGGLLVEYLHGDRHYRVILVPDARKALQLVQGIQPDLFVIDQLLPDMSGLEVYDLLHSRKNLAAIPVLMISAGTFAHKITDHHLPFLRKPFTLEELDYFLETLLP
jgi:DNA-binding response OmpR family regulator